MKVAKRLLQEGCWCRKMEIRLKNIGKKYGDFEALKGVNLVFKSGKFYGLLGPNGAGKTTLLNLLIKNIKQSSGDIFWEVDGGTLSPKNFHRHIGVVFQGGRLDEALTVEENLVTRGSLYGLSKKEVRKRIKELQEYLNVSEIRRQRYGRLSGGQKRKVDIARALLHRPSLLLLDEPTTGLDPQSRRDLWVAIKQLNQKTKMTVVLITHYLEEMSSCDILDVIISGEVYYSGTVSAFIKQNSTTNLSITLKNRDLFQLPASLDLASKCHLLTDKKVIIKDVSVGEIIRVISENQEESIIESFDVEHSNLESAYLNVLKEKGAVKDA